MICYADITQRTGEDWNDVGLTISTSAPSQATSPAELGTWYLNAYEQYKKEKGSIDKAFAPSSALMEMGDELYVRGGQAGEAKYIADGVNIGNSAILRSNNFSFTYDCRHKKSVASGNESEKTLIAEWELESDLAYLCRPKNNLAVFRLAKATNQADSPLLPGTVSIFADGDYIGQTFLRQFIAPSEEFEIGFGLDNNFKVERNVIAVKNSTSSGIFSSERIVKKQTIEIKLTNNYRDNRIVMVEESLPVSQDERIKVKFDNILPAFSSIDKEGKADWSLDLVSGKELTITIPIKIEHEEGIIVSGI